MGTISKTNYSQSVFVWILNCLSWKNILTAAPQLKPTIITSLPSCSRRACCAILMDLLIDALTTTAAYSRHQIRVTTIEANTHWGPELKLWSSHNTAMRTPTIPITFGSQHQGPGIGGMRRFLSWTVWHRCDDRNSWRYNNGPGDQPPKISTVGFAITFVHWSCLEQRSAKWEKKNVCIHRESNPGHLLGRQIFYH
jgi:hypothetical protein